MLARNTRYILIAVLALNLGACSSLLPKRLGGASAEPAKPRVAIVVDGAKSAAVKSTIETMFSDKYDIVSSEEYRASAERIDAVAMEQDNVVKVAGELDADAVLHAVLLRKGKRYKLFLRLRDGTSGDTLERFNITLRARRLRTRDERQLARKLMPALDSLSPAPAAEPTAVADNSDSKSETRIAELSSEDSDISSSAASRAKYDENGQAIDDEMPDILKR